MWAPWLSVPNTHAFLKQVKIRKKAATFPAIQAVAGVCLHKGSSVTIWTGFGRNRGEVMIFQEGGERFPWRPLLWASPGFESYRNDPGMEKCCQTTPFDSSQEKKLILLDLFLEGSWKGKRAQPLLPKCLPLFLNDPCKFDC